MSTPVVVKKEQSPGLKGYHDFAKMYRNAYKAQHKVETVPDLHITEAYKLRKAHESYDSFAKEYKFPELMSDEQKQLIKDAKAAKKSSKQVKPSAELAKQKQKKVSPDFIKADNESDDESELQKALDILDRIKAKRSNK